MNDVSLRGNFFFRSKVTFRTSRAREIISFRKRVRFRIAITICSIFPRLVQGLSLVLRGEGNVPTINRERETRRAEDISTKRRGNGSECSKRSTFGRVAARVDLRAFPYLFIYSERFERSSLHEYNIRRFRGCGLEDTARNFASSYRTFCRAARGVPGPRAPVCIRLAMQPLIIQSL